MFIININIILEDAVKRVKGSRINGAFTWSALIIGPFCDKILYCMIVSLFTIPGFINYNET